MTLNVLSIVVIGRNEGEHLVHCFESVRQIVLPGTKKELIYVDSRSKDDSVEIAKLNGAKVIELIDEQLTPGLARNTGWKATKGEFILFLDGDSAVDPEFVRKALLEFKDRTVAVVSGILKERHPEKTLYNRVFDVDWDISSKNYCGGNALIRRGALEEVNGYNPALIAGEEPEMCERLKDKGYVVRHIEVLMGTHDLNLQTFEEYWIRCKRCGYAYAYIVKLLRNTPHELWRKESLHNLLKGGFILVGFVLSIFMGLLSGSFVPIMIYFFFITALVIRTAARKAKVYGWKTSLLYGIHSHFQHLPMTIGQLSFLCHAEKTQNKTEKKV